MGFVLSFAVYDLRMFSEPRQNIQDIGLVERSEGKALLAEVAVECCQYGNVANFNVASCHFNPRPFSLQ